MFYVYERARGYTAAAVGYTVIGDCRLSYNTHRISSIVLLSDELRETSDERDEPLLDVNVRFSTLVSTAEFRLLLGSLLWLLSTS